jgi:hypothetical protein
LLTWQARGPTIFTDWRKHILKSIFLTPEGDRTLDYFNTWKDIVIPGMESVRNGLFDVKWKLAGLKADASV